MAIALQIVPARRAVTTPVEALVVNVLLTIGAGETGSINTTFIVPSIPGQYFPTLTFRAGETVILNTTIGIEVSRTFLISYRNEIQNFFNIK